MNTETDKPAGTAMEAVMGAYFDALLHEEGAPPAVPAQTTAKVVELPHPQPETRDPEPATPDYCLIKVGSLTLGLPMGAVLDVVPAPAHWSPAPIAHAATLGGYAVGESRVTVVNTAAVLAPEAAARMAVQNRFIVLLNGRRWALACDSAGDLFSPDPAQVHWRGAQGKRPWLAGTVGSPAVALLDIDALIGLLEP